MTVGDIVITAELDNSETTKEFIATLPRTLSMNRYDDREYYGRIEAITENGEAIPDFTNGDVTYYPAGPSFAVFFAGEERSDQSGLIRMGKVTSDLSVFDSLDDTIEVKIELKAAGDPDTVTRREDLPLQTEPGNPLSAGFTGTAYLTPMIANDDIYNFPQTNHIVFEPGARSNWHTHGGMIVMATGGVGYYQEEGKPAQILRPGDVVECAPGVNHWHGAAPDSWFSQVVIYDSHYSTREAAVGEMIGPVTDEYYAALEAEEYTGRTVSDDNGFMFQRSEQPMNMGTFNGPIYLSTILGPDNAAGAPGLQYVVFEPGVINNWHSHAGGQILIVTDGVGYHQIQGQPVEVLHPGDVAMCPPSETHWHGGSANTSFAHIAVSTNPGAGGVEWYDILSDEEYAQLPTE